jgi:hypothetical protein
MILLDELTCPVCGVEHSDHLIDGEAGYHDVLWENDICDACDSWAWLIESDPVVNTVRLDNACYRRGRSS